MSNFNIIIYNFVYFYNYIGNIFSGMLNTCYLFYLSHATSESLNNKTFSTFTHIFLPSTVDIFYIIILFYYKNIECNNLDN